MADDGKSIADAYRNWPGDSATAPATATPVADGASIADAYRTQDAAAKAATLPGPGVPSADVQSADTGLPLPQSPPPQLPQGGSNLANALDPAPNTTYMGMLPIARDDKTGELRYGVLPRIPREMLQGTVQGIRDIFSGNVGAETTVDPATGKIQYGMTPGANLLLGTGARPLAYSGPNGLQFVPPGTFDAKAPLSPQFTASPMAAELEARLRGDTTAGAGRTSGGPMPTVTVRPAGPTPTTSAEALPVATALLDKARASGADLTPDYTNKFIDKATADATPAGPGTAAVAGPNDPVAAMVQRLQTLRDKPLNIADVMGMDQELNARQRAAIKTDPDLARRIGNLQDSLRDQVDNATQANVGGGAEGWQAFQDGRAAYSQYKKMQAVEDMKERADGMQNPTSSYKTAVNNFVSSPKARGWSDDEIASLKDSADRGFAGGTLHMLGSRLIPLVAGGVGLSKYGAIGALATMVGSHYAGDALRNWGNALQTGRVNRTLGGLGSSIQPPNVLQQAP